MGFDLNALASGGILDIGPRSCRICRSAVDGDDTFDHVDAASFAQLLAKLFDALGVHPGYLRVEPAVMRAACGTERASALSDAGPWMWLLLKIGDLGERTKASRRGRFLFTTGILWGIVGMDGLRPTELVCENWKR